MRYISLCALLTIIGKSNTESNLDEIVNSGEYWTRPKEAWMHSFEHHGVVLITNPGNHWLISSTLNTSVNYEKVTIMNSNWTKKHDFPCYEGKTLGNVFHVASRGIITNIKWFTYINSLTCTCTARRAEQFCRSQRKSCNLVCKVEEIGEEICRLNLNTKLSVKDMTHLEITAKYGKQKNAEECLLGLANEKANRKIEQCGRDIQNLPDDQKSDHCIVRGALGICAKQYIECNCSTEGWEIFKQNGNFEPGWITFLGMLRIAGINIPGLEFIEDIKDVNKEEILKCIEALDYNNGNIVTKPVFLLISLCFLRLFM